MWWDHFVDEGWTSFRGLMGWAYGMLGPLCLAGGLGVCWHHTEGYCQYIQGYQGSAGIILLYTLDLDVNIICT